MRDAADGDGKGGDLPATVYAQPLCSNITGSMLCSQHKHDPDVCAVHDPGVQLDTDSIRKPIHKIRFLVIAGRHILLILVR